MKLLTQVVYGSTPVCSRHSCLVKISFILMFNLCKLEHISWCCWWTLNTLLMEILCVNNEHVVDGHVVDEHIVDWHIVDEHVVDEHVEHEHVELLQLQLLFRWIEHAMRHGGGKHLRWVLSYFPLFVIFILNITTRPASLELSRVQYYLLDVIGFILVVLVVSLAIFIKLVLCLCRCCCASRKKSKTDWDWVTCCLVRVPNHYFCQVSRGTWLRDVRCCQSM